MPAKTNRNKTSSKKKQHKFELFREFSVADWITVLNCFFGVSSILFCLNYLENDRKLDYILLSFCCFPLSLLADILDGRVARSKRFKSIGGLPPKSIYGGDLDSLSDVISFGVAPGVLAFTLGMRGMWDGSIIVFNSVCGLSRLARYNVTMDDMTDPKLGKVTYFEGVPIPGNLVNVAILVLDYYFMDSFFCDKLKFRDPIFKKHFHPLSLMYLAIGLLMVSKVKIPKF